MPRTWPGAANSCALSAIRGNFYLAFFTSFVIILLYNNMEFKKIKKTISRFFAWIGLNTCVLFGKILPQPLLYGFAGMVARIGYLCAARQRTVAIESLKTAFGAEKSDEERKAIARQCFVSMAKSGVEIMFLVDKPDLLRRKVNFLHKERLDNALKEGKGVILVSAHFGNFPLLLGRLSLEGYRTGGIMRPMRDARAEKIFLQKRNRYGIKTIYSQPRKECVEETVRSLRNNEIVFIPLDQNFGTGGVFVDFFGTKAATATGPAILAQRTQAALLPCFIVRQPDDTHQIIFEEPLRISDGGGCDPAQVVEIIQSLTRVIESYIRQYPAEWGWIHRRWKSKPSVKGGE